MNTIKQIFADNNLAIQQLSYSCGPVSLLNILYQKGDFSHTEEELAELCDAKPGIGTANETLVKVAEDIGLEVAEVKQDANVSDIERNIDTGRFVIVNYFSAYSGNGHYSIISEYDDRSLYFRDCSRGFFVLDKDEFENFWYNQNKTIYGWYMATE